MKVLDDRVERAGDDRIELLCEGQKSVLRTKRLDIRPVFRSSPFDVFAAGTVQSRRRVERLARRANKIVERHGGEAQLFLPR